jgi:hypothetical protein
MTAARNIAPTVSHLLPGAGCVLRAIGVTGLL